MKKVETSRVYDRLEQYADGWRENYVTSKLVNQAIENAADLDILVKYIEADANMLNKVLAEIKKVAYLGLTGPCK